MKTARLLPFLCLLLAACAGPRWERPNTPPEIADRDDMDCQRWARTEASNRASGFYDGPVYSQRSISRPEPVFDRNGYRAMDENALTDYCMRSRGYQSAR
jgi:hypothetical protein